MSFWDQVTASFVGDNEVIFIPEKSVHLSRLGAIFLETQQR